MRFQLRNLCKRLNWDVFELTNTIVEQKNIGSVICISDESQCGQNEDVNQCPLAVTSILNIKQHWKCLSSLAKIATRLR